MRISWWLTALAVSLTLGLVLAWLAPSVRSVLATLPYLLVTELLFFAWGGGMSRKRRSPPTETPAAEDERLADAA